MKEFKKFIARGNVLDLAVGLILATYFGAIVSSFVDDILMPPIGKLIGGVDFSNLKLIISKEVAESAPGAGDGIAEVAINYGTFINTIITFLIVAYAVFLVVKFYNKMMDSFKKQEEEAPAAPPEPTKEEVLLTEIRDLLKKQQQ